MVGGIVGLNYGIVQASSFNTGTITGTSGPDARFVGGLVGYKRCWQYY